MTLHRATVIIRGGSVVDGTGSPPRVADVAIDGDKIVAVGPSLEVSDGAREIDATGLIVAPGWIDVHTHYVRARRPAAVRMLLPSGSR